VLSSEGLWCKSEVVLLLSLGEMEARDDLRTWDKPQASADGMGFNMAQ
jgi:hypothetical protein